MEIKETKKLVYTDRKIWDPVPTTAERIAAGKKQRGLVPRESHGSKARRGDRSDPVQLLIDSNEGRLPELIPIRFYRMLQSPFAFMRGSAAVMAEDLSRLPSSGIFVQCCGDCHLMNFGGYATPERNEVFDINDFDETLPAPFEWDVKRLAASFVVAGRYREFTDKDNRKAAYLAVKTYSDKMRDFAGMSQLDIWYNRLDTATIIDVFKSDKDFIRPFREMSEKARFRAHEISFPKLSEVKNGRRKIIDQPPLIYHPEGNTFMESAYNFFEEYYYSLTDDKKALLKRYRLEDAAYKVVGVGSVGTRCFIGLFAVNDSDAVILQFKQGSSSVLEKYAGKSKYNNHGARIVNGQRLMQTVSDIFLGWTKSSKGLDFYVRQLRDIKASAHIENFIPKSLMDYAFLCGWALAKSHAKAGMAPEIAGYIGKSDVFSQSVADFAVQYANQTEKDFTQLQKAAKDKRIAVFQP
jgi:uncharacterized protein (DUF2252 family)